jgi:retron-type reverse transcriptase
LQLELFPPPEIALEEVFEAYYDCRRNKRRTASAAEFELDYERNLIRLWQEINGGTYEPEASVAFVVERPVKREVFAARFRDRVVHHLIVNKINHLLEREFILDSYACRPGKGTHFGIRRVQRFIRRCSAGSSRDAYILKLDIRGFFMSIDRELLFRRLTQFLRQRYSEPDNESVLELCRKTILHDPTSNCRIRGAREAWNGLPPDKSLFYTAPGCGLPIGNLTSQVFANFYLNCFDHFVKHTLSQHYYGRYVDDFVIVHESRDALKQLLPRLRRYLRDELALTLHPDKVYLQHVRHGVPFLGARIGAQRITAGSRLKANFHAAVSRHNRISENAPPTHQEREHLRASINSYLGILKQFATYRFRKRTLLRLNGWWRRRFRVDHRCEKVVRRRKTSQAKTTTRSGSST